MDTEEQLTAELDVLIRSSPAFDKEIAASYENLLRTTGDQREKSVQIYLFWVVLFPDEAREDLINRWKPK